MSERVGRTRGFTLIEMAIVLVVIGLVVGGGITAVAPILQSSKVTDTKARLDRIEDALVLYTIRNGCLPCPASNTATDGTAGQAASSAPTTYETGCSTGDCTFAQGVVPWKALGISENDAADAFGARISYALTAGLEDADSMLRSGSSYAPLGALIVNNAATVEQTPAANRAAYVLVSHGRNRHYGFMQGTGAQVPSDGVAANEAENALADAADLTYVQDEENSSGGANYFDDIVRWRTKPVIVQMCGAGSCGNP